MREPPGARRFSMDATPPRPSWRALGENAMPFYLSPEFERQNADPIKRRDYSNAHS
jgi:hypothetical protein